MKKEPLEEIRIYRFVDPSVIYQNQTLLLIALGATENTFQSMNLYVDHEKGHFVYKNFIFEDSTFNVANIAVPQTEREAKKIATEFILKSDSTISKDPRFKSKKFPRLFTNLRFVSAISVGDPLQPSIRSWEIKYMPFVNPSLYERAVPVVDAEVVVEVGFKNNIVGLRYFWLPLSRSEETSRYSLIYKDDKGNDVTPFITYQSEPGMNLIAPYAVVNDPKKLNEIENKINRQTNPLNQPLTS